MLRPVLDVIIWLARNMPVTFVLLGAGTWWVARRGRSWEWRNSPVLNRMFVVTGLALLFAFVGIGVWYLTADGFAGEVEPIVSCLSWLVQSGHPLYTEFDAAERYSVLYGPTVFLTNGLFLRILGPSLASAKLASLLGITGSVMFLYAAVARRRRDPLALGAAALAVLYYWTQGFAVYLVRPDALLVFAVGVGLYAATRSRRWLAIAGVAATAGFAINLKAHGIVYFLPVAVLLHRRLGRRATVAAGALTLVAAALPFLYTPQVSLVNYIGWLTNAVGHGLEARTLGQTLGYAGFLMLPVLALIVVAPDRRDLVAAHLPELLVLAPVYVLILLLAAKPGAGLVHLLPLVPTTIYLLAVLAREIVTQPRALGPPFSMQQAVIVTTVATALLAGSVNAYRAVRYVDYQIGRTPELGEDVRGIMQAYPGLSIAMACGGENLAFRTTWLRPLLVFADNPLLIDPISVMDASLSGHDLSAETYRAISEGRIAMWLVPRSEQPFAKENWYAPHNDLFPAAFREHFRQWYTPRAQSRYFDLWFWNGLPETAGIVQPFLAGEHPDNGVGGADLVSTHGTAVLNNP